MTWNYRVVQKVVGDQEEVGIYSVYYDSQGHPIARSEEPERLMEYSIEGLDGKLQLMRECLNKPVLLSDEIGSGNNLGSS